VKIARKVEGEPTEISYKSGKKKWRGRRGEKKKKNKIVWGEGWVADSFTKSIAKSKKT